MGPNPPQNPATPGGVNAAATGTPTKAKVPQTKPARSLEETRRDLRKGIDRLQKNAEVWRDRDKTCLVVAQWYFLVASLIMGINLIAKQNVHDLGGWMPFCLAALAATTVGLFILNKHVSEEPKTSRDKCLELMSEFKFLLRRTQTMKETSKDVQRLDRRLAKAEISGSVYLLGPSRLKWWGWAYIILAAGVVAYLAYEMWYAGWFKFPHTG